MSISPFTLPLDTKMEWLRAKLATLLNAHGYATFNVHKFITAGMLGMVSKYDVKNVFGSPVAWCRVAPIDMSESELEEDAAEDIGGSHIMESHEFSVLLQFQFQESDVYAGSTFEQFNNMLFAQSPAGVLFEFATLGAEVVEDEQYVKIDQPTAIAIPEFPVAFYGSQDNVMVHHCDFRLSLT